ncbi:DNA repair protein RadC [Thalassolituus sp.]|jgi:DNA repair protein RadC|uniref:RadC family protein n=1 Tax=Thalassolituus sp. TaxID=2030822 RepID=UPI0032D8C0AC|tara:strand:+ start:27731 stop:28171 length:441 start_codon:yes stop_codon:yes gene_type:complete
MDEQDIIDHALTILESRLHKPQHTFTNPRDVRDYLKLNLAEKEHEIFAIMYLDNQNGMINLTEMFQGTIDAATVYPREVVKTALQFNAAAVILAHNHPSGVAEPSQADKLITQRLQQALSLVDIRTLDHFIIGSGHPYSFAEHGLL